MAGGRGGVRPGAGRKVKRRGRVTRAALLDEVRQMVPADTIATLFAAAAAGDLASLRRLTVLFDRAEQNVLAACALNLNHEKNIKEKSKRDEPIKGDCGLFDLK